MVSYPLIQMIIKLITNTTQNVLTMHNVFH